MKSIAGVLRLSVALGLVLLGLGGAAAAAHGATGHLFFVTQPQDAQSGSVITTTAFNSPPGGPIVVSGASPNASVTMSIFSSNPAGAVLSGTTTQTADGTGTASFGNLSIAPRGIVILQATSNGVSATSHQFTIWDVAQSCVAGTQCTANFSSDLLSESVTGTSTTNGFLLVSVGQNTVNCNDGFSHAPKSTTESNKTFNGTAPKTVVVTIPKAEVQQLPVTNNGAGQFAICYTTFGNGTFTDANGNTVTIGDLPDCNKVRPAQTPPCVKSITKDNAGDIVETFIIPADDPGWT